MNHLKRTALIQAQLQEENADWFIVTNLTNIRYLSGYTGSYALLLIGREKRYILTDGRYQEQVQREVADYEPVIQGTRKLWEAVRETLGDVSKAVIWFESDHLTYGRYEDMVQALNARSFLGKRDGVETPRSVKDEEEIALLRKSLHIAEQAMFRAFEEINEGMTERELAHLIEHEMWKAGAEKESFESLVLFGPRSSFCHGKPTDNSLRKGDIVLMDFGCVYQGYCSDITRTVFFGEPNNTEFKSMYEIVHQANRRAAECTKTGVHGKEADEFARGLIRENGYDHLFIHGLGHGVGLEVHEAPRLSYLSENLLQNGQVVTIEPGLYVEGQGGLRIENMAVIRDDGCEVLNQTPTDMLIL